MKNDARYALGDLFLTKVDRASMACSLESRAPFLASNVRQLVRRLPTKYKVGFFRTKTLLKDIALARLPREAVLRKKRGFGIPMRSLLDGPLKGLVLSALSKEKIERASLFSYQKVGQLVDQHFRGLRDNSAKIWTLMVFQIWYERWISGADA
jgi:asparagine synthase (glutamine-hydrolysing)